ncbi:MAG TPA: DUF692 family protein [Bryobacteraceae bacterium]|nr:DUF692 family protein [Bryobacteraceae bacterium]
MGWRTDLAAGILSNLDRIDVVEVIADDYFDASSRDVRALRTLSRQTPVMLHAVGLGMASTLAVDSRRVQKLARLVHAVEPECWSEHLAFVRGGGVEIGHLAAPPRNRFSIEGTLTNIDRATRCIGARPLVENIPTLIDPPGSTMDEAGWLSALLEDTQAHLLLDLHNVHTNATNFGFDARVFVDALPVHRIGAIHIAGGRPMGRRVLDDHRDDVPDTVYDLLAHVASRVSEPLTVILERDGAYPSMGDLLAQLDQARAAVARGRAEVGTSAATRNHSYFAA